MAGSRYVEVPANTLLAVLTDICVKVKGAGGAAKHWTHGNEVVFDLQPKDRTTFVRVYTSLAEGDNSVRACGEDAVRLLVGTEFGGKFRPLSKSRRIYRTAPAGPEPQRVEAFLRRLTEALREVYRQAAKDHPNCPRCGSPMARRKAGKTNNEFYGCLKFPDCRGTREVTDVPSRSPAPSPAREKPAPAYKDALLEAALKGHDWYYSYSDDPHVHRRGAKQREEILVLLGEVTPKTGEKLWLEHAPKEFRFPR